MKKLARFAGVLSLAALPLFPQGRDHGRSRVISQQGIAATSQTPASHAAAQVLASIADAEQGSPVTEYIQEAWAGSLTTLKSQPETAPLFLPGGAAPQVGELFRNPEMARALRIIADKGRDAFYKGELASAILK